LQRLARRPPRHQRAVTRRLPGLDGRLGARVQEGAVDGQDVGQKDLGVTAGLRDTGGLQGRPPLVDQGGRGGPAQTRTSSFSASAWKCAAIGSMTGSRSPSRISGRRWMVRLTR